MTMLGFSHMIMPRKVCKSPVETDWLVAMRSVKIVSPSSDTVLK